MCVNPKKSIFKSCWTSYKNDTSDASYERFKVARRIYRNTCRSYRRQYRQSVVNDLCVNMANNPRKFWSKLRNNKKLSKLPDVTDTELFEHFSHLNGTEPDISQPFDLHIREHLNTHMNDSMDQVLYNRLKCWESDHNVLHEEQAGFRSGYSTTDHIFTLQSLITASKHSKSKLYCGFIDFRKAFNSVYRDGLWYKIINMGR